MKAHKVSSCVIFITAKDLKEGKKISTALLKEKLVACVNIVQGIQSFFWWQGKIDTAKEVLLIIKTRKTHCQKIVTAVKSLHSYTVPEIIALPIIAGNRDYLQWIEASTR